MKKISFSIPVAAESLQFSGKRMAVGKHGKMKGKPMFFADKKADSYKKTVSLLCAQHRPAEPLSGPLRLELFFVVERPERLNTRKHSGQRELCDKRPDSSNLLKAFEDILTRARFWGDDGQIARHALGKDYAARGEQPSITVTIEQLEEQPVQGRLFPR